MWLSVSLSTIGVVFAGQLSHQRAQPRVSGRRPGGVPSDPTLVHSVAPGTLRRFPLSQRLAEVFGDLGMLLDGPGQVEQDAPQLPGVIPVMSMRRSCQRGPQVRLGFPTSPPSSSTTAVPSSYSALHLAVAMREQGPDPRGFKETEDYSARTHGSNGVLQVCTSVGSVGTREC